MNNHDQYTQQACYDLVDGILFEDEAEVTWSASVLSDAGVPFCDAVEIEDENFDEEHLQFAITAAACSRLVDDWSYFRFAARLYGKKDSWLYFLNEITTIDLQREGIHDPQERINLVLYLNKQYKEQIAPHTGVRKYAKKLGKTILTLFSKNS